MGEYPTSFEAKVNSSLICRFFKIGSMLGPDLRAVFVDLAPKIGFMIRILKTL